VPGRDGATLIANVIQALNAGVPVPVGMRWAMGGQNWWRSGYLNEQPAYEDKGHAVTIVGYKSETGRIEDTVFTFKNSWGTEWGANGYGFATYKFLSKNLHTAVILEVTAK
jgi:C1A family cysteine protease